MTKVEQMLGIRYTFRFFGTPYHFSLITQVFHKQHHQQKM